MTKFKEEKGHEKEFHDESVSYGIISGNGVLTVSSYKCFCSFCSSKACYEVHKDDP